MVVEELDVTSDVELRSVLANEVDPVTAELDARVEAGPPPEPWDKPGMLSSSRHQCRPRESPLLDDTHGTQPENKFAFL